MASLPLIRVIGSLNIDFTTLTPRFPSPGETLTATSLTIAAGGKGANQAVACGRAAFSAKGQQDVRVEMVGAVGANDTQYKTLLRPTLEKAGVDCSGIRELENCQTGTATIIVDEGAGGENRILVVPGANHAGMERTEQVMQKVLEKPWPDVVVLQGEIPKETVFGILEEYGKKTGSQKTPSVVFNPAPVFEEGIPKNLLPMVEVLIMNETEMLQVASRAEGLGDLPNEEKNLKNSTLDQVSVKFHDIGVNTVIVTLGAEGVYYSTNDGRRDKVPGVKVKRVVDTTAAGDTFVGHFSAALARWKGDQDGDRDGLKKLDIESAIRTANEAAAKCVQKPGAMESIPWGHEV